MVNIGRSATINGARITEVRQDANQPAATKNEVECYKTGKRTTDLITGLNSYDHERLIRAREAMMLAVQVFNSPNVTFKIEAFSVLAVIAWTYLLHEYYFRKRIPISRTSKGSEKEFSLSLTEMINREDCPITKGMKKNLGSIYEIRTKVEHKLFGGKRAYGLGRSFSSLLPQF